MMIMMTMDLIRMIGSIVHVSDLLPQCNWFSALNLMLELLSKPVVVKISDELCGLRDCRNRWLITRDMASHILAITWILLWASALSPVIHDSFPIQFL
jgi:hypothetical protein